jgi:hypothetical protein
MHFYYAIPCYLASLLPKRSAKKNKTCSFFFLGYGVVAELFWHDTITRRVFPSVHSVQVALNDNDSNSKKEILSVKKIATVN